MKSATRIEIAAYVAIAALALATLMWASPGCAGANPSITQTGADNQAETNQLKLELAAKIDEIALLADKSTTVSSVAPAPEITQGEGSTADVDTSTAVADTSQKGLFNANLAIIGGSGITGFVGLALWLRWARQTSETRTNAQTERMRRLIEVIRAMVDKLR